MTEKCNAATVSVPGWQPIETAPKDGRSIIGWCVHEADPYVADEQTGRLTIYGAHAEGMFQAPDGPHIVQWGGEYVEADFVVPDWWFVSGSDFETVANPTHWMPLPEAAPRFGEEE